MKPFCVLVIGAVALFFFLEVIPFWKMIRATRKLDHAVKHIHNGPINRGSLDAIWVLLSKWAEVMREYR